MHRCRSGLVFWSYKDSSNQRTSSVVSWDADRQHNRCEEQIFLLRNMVKYFLTCDLNIFSRQCSINHSSSSRMSITMRHVSVLAFILGVGHVLSQDESGLPAGSEDILQYPYSETFSCEGQDYGYYADVQSGCQVSQNSRQAIYTYKLQKE